MNTIRWQRHCLRHRYVEGPFMDVLNKWLRANVICEFGFTSERLFEFAHICICQCLTFGRLTNKSEHEDGWLVRLATAIIIVHSNNEIYGYLIALIIPVKHLQIY